MGVMVYSGVYVSLKECRRSYNSRRPILLVNLSSAGYCAVKVGKICLLLAAPIAQKSGCHEKCCWAVVPNQQNSNRTSHIIVEKHAVAFGHCTLAAFDSG